jgi:hypothetical protein
MGSKTTRRFSQPEAQAIISGCPTKVPEPASRFIFKPKVKNRPMMTRFRYALKNLASVRRSHPETERRISCNAATDLAAHPQFSRSPLKLVAPAQTGTIMLTGSNARAAPIREKKTATGSEPKRQRSKIHSKSRSAPSISFTNSLGKNCAPR